MTIASTTRRAGPFSGNDVTTTFPFSFKVFAEGDVQVFLTEALVTSELTLDVDYSVSLNADQDESPGGTVTYPLSGSPLTTGVTLDIQGDIAYTQPASLPQGGNFSPRVIENALDRLTMQTIQLADAIELGPIPGGVSLSGLPTAAERAGYLLGFDSEGNPEVVAATSGSAAELAMDLLSTNNAAKGAGQVGYGMGLSYGAGTVGRKLGEWVSVKDYGAVGDGVTDDTVAIQAAINASFKVYFPMPSAYYKVSAEILVPATAELVGENGRRTFIQGTHAGVIFRLQYLPVDSKIEGLFFQGAGCTAIAPEDTGAAFSPYLARANISRCHFSYDLAYGINADLINSHIDMCSFGYSGPNGIDSGWVGGMVAIRCMYGATNYVNINSVNRCIFKVGTAVTAGIQLTAGTLFHFNYCDFEAGGKVLSANDVTGLAFNGCWFENNTTATGVITVGSYLGHVVFDKCWISAAAEAPYFFTWASGWATNGVTFRNCNIGLGATSNLHYDSTLLSTGPIGGQVVVEGNYMSGGAAGSQWLLGLGADAGSTWTPTNSGLTIVNGTGGCTISGRYKLVGNIVHFTIKFTQTGTCTTANSGAGVNYLTLPSSFPFPKTNSVGQMMEENGNTTLGACLIYANGRVYPPAFTAKAGNIDIAGWYFI